LSDLTAPSELPVDLQRELDDLAAREGRLTHYYLLGVSVDADAGTIRRAYLEKTRRFHPDSYYGKQLGKYGTILTKAFQRLAHAYQMLTDETARSAYDREHGDLFSGDDHAKVHVRLQAETEDNRRSAEKRERLLRMKGFARLGAARQLYEAAIEQAKEGKRVEAIAGLKAARDLDPARKEIAEKLTELEKEQFKARAASALALAHDQEESGDKAKALATYANGLQLDPKQGEAALGAARCAEALRDYPQLLTFALRACELSPKSLDAHLLAARGFAALKQKPRAKAELELILTRDPKHAEAKALLKSL
jgi:curved DNA-binding protein CbpA